jgi:PAS domain S-box-containing protein
MRWLRRAENDNELLTSLISFLKTMADCLVIVNRNGRFLYANDAATKSLGYSQDELLKSNIYDTGIRESKKSFKEQYLSILHKNGLKFETLGKRKDGSLINLEVSVNTFDLSGKKTICYIWHEISARKKAEDELGKARKRIKDLLEQHAVQIEDKEQRLEVKEQELKEELTAHRKIRDEYDARLKAARKEHKEELDAHIKAEGRIGEIQEEMKSLLEQHAVQIEDKEQRLEAKEQELKEELTAHRKIRDEYDTRLKAAQEEHKEELDARKKAEDELGKARETIEELSKKHTSRLEAEKELLGKELAARRESENKLQEFRAKMQILLRDYVVRFETAEKKLNEERRARNKIEEELRKPKEEAQNLPKDTPPPEAVKDAKEQSVEHKMLEGMHLDRDWTVAYTLNDGICILQNDLLQHVNKQLADIIGYSTDALIGKLFKNFVHPDSLYKFEQNYNRFISGEENNQAYELVLTHKNGHKVPVNFNLSATDYGGRRVGFTFIHKS